MQSLQLLFEDAQPVAFLEHSQSKLDFKRVEQETFENCLIGGQTEVDLAPIRPKRINDFG